MKRVGEVGLVQAWSRRSWEFRILLVLTVVLAAVILLNRFGVLTPDTKPEVFLQPAQTARRFARAWLESPSLGEPNYNTGTGALAALFAVPDWMGIPPWLTMRLWRFGLIFIGAWGARLVVRELARASLGERGLAIAGVAAAVAYAANPYIVVGGGTTPTLQPYAFLPWLVLCWLKGFRSPSWRWAVLAALSLAAMGGVNAGIAPLMQLVVLVPLFVHAVLVERHRVAPVLWLVARTGLIYAALSAFWLVPAIVSLGTGLAVAATTEDVGSINMANSFPEVLRGLGMWTLYGLGGGGPFDPDRFMYVTSPVVILLSFGGPVVAGLGVLLSRSPARVFGATSVLVATLLMVGSFPTEEPTPWGRAQNAALESVPGLVAFRTTNKVGSLLELGLAVLIGLAAAALAVRLATVWQRVTALGAAAAITAAGVAPAMTGGLYWIPLDLPDYWEQAAQAVNERKGTSRVLMVPGVGIPDYAWGYSGPDELGPSLFHRPTVFHSAALPGGEFAAAATSEVDRRLQLGTLEPGTISTLSDYAGIGDVVGRYDLAREDIAARRVEEQLSEDPGLGAPEVFGPDDVGRGAPGPVTVRPVIGSSPDAPVRVVGATGALIIDGSGAALPGLTAAGLLDTRPGLLFAANLDDGQLAQAFADGGRMVLTDSNLRREWSKSNPLGVGPVLPVELSPDNTRALFTPEAQTTASQRGNAAATTEGAGFLFGPYPYGAVEQAFDGDRSTAWRFGNFGSGVGNAVVIVPQAPLPIPAISLSALQTEGSGIASARIIAEVEGRSVVRDVEFTGWASFPVTVAVSERPVSSLRIEVTGVSGDGDGSVGFSEIDIPGLRIERVLEVSDHLARRAAAAAESAGISLQDMPLDVILERGVGDENGLTTEEAKLEREFSLPARKAFSVNGDIRLAAGISDSRIDAITGSSNVVRAHSSSRLFHRPGVRASLALDGTLDQPDLSTGWAPNNPVIGEWIAVDFPEQLLESFTITQGGGPNRITRVLVSVNDGEPFEADLAEGTTRIELPETTLAERVRVLIMDRSGFGFVRILDIGLPRVAPAAGPQECLMVATLSGRPVRAQLAAHLDDLLEGEPVPLEPCDGPIELDAGLHRLRAAPDFAVDRLHLADSSRSERPDPVAIDVLAQSAGSIAVHLPHGCTACLVSTGQAFDPGWMAHIDGDDAGAPIVVDGFAAGWRIDAPSGAELTMEFRPTRAVLGGWLVSAIALLGSLTVLVGGRVIRRLRLLVREHVR